MDIIGVKGPDKGKAVIEVILIQSILLYAIFFLKDTLEESYFPTISEFNEKSSINLAQSIDHNGVLLSSATG